MDNKAKLSECIGWLAVALAQYVGEYGLPYGYRVDQADYEAIMIRMYDIERMHKNVRYFSTDYILSMEDPIGFLKMVLIDMHKELSGGAE